MRCGDLFITDKHQCFRGIKGQTGIENRRKIILFQLFKEITADLRSIQDGLQGGSAHGVKRSAHTKGQTKIGCCICDSLFADAGCKGREIPAQRRTGIQRLDIEFFDLTSLPAGLFCHALVVAKHLREGFKVGCIVVVTG